MCAEMLCLMDVLSNYVVDTMDKPISRNHGESVLPHTLFIAHSIIVYAVLTTNTRHVRVEIPNTQKSTQAC